jgi:dienelactone hydrolase
MRRIFLFAVAFILCGLAGCSSLPQRLDYANVIAGGAGMQAQEINTGGFILTTYSRIADKNQPVNVYIEGDGFAWASTHRLSTNPTPKDAFTLRLAAADGAANVVYIARPCQYTSLVKDKKCSPKYWSGSRFSEIVVDSVNKAISSYSTQFVKPQINLIGYSGGAAVAVLVAARRDDVVSLRTVAGNLDHVAINNFHHVDNLDDSLNPIDVAEKLASLPQYHFAGAEDKIVPLEVTAAFAKKSEKGNGCVRVSSINGATHDTGWLEHWREILAQPVLCGTNVKKLEKK